MALRNFVTGKNIPKDKTKFRRSGVAPFGYAFLDGQLKLDIKEHLIVRKILKLHQSGNSTTAIAETLNDQKIKTRKGSTWTRGMVLIIIKREEKL
jgi:hypothetical protein